MGEFDIFVPYSEISHTTKDPKKAEGKQFEAIVTEIDKDGKEIVASIKMLEDEIKFAQENLFWKSIFINKIVEGKIKKIMPYGVFASVGGIDCFCHISELSYSRLGDPSEVVKEGETYTFKVISVDRENKKVALSKKALDESPKLQALKKLEIGQECEGSVVKILNFGAIIKLENGVTGLLHIKDTGAKNDQNIYEIVKLDEKIKVKIIDINLDEEKLAFKLI